MHVNDCRKRAELDMKRNQKQLEEIINLVESLVPTTQNLDEDVKALRARKDDLVCIMKGLETLETAVDNLQKEVGA